MAAGELGLVNESSCIMSAILDSMLNAKFPRTREYASKIACPTSFRISNHNHTHYFSETVNFLIKGLNWSSPCQIGFLYNQEMFEEDLDICSLASAEGILFCPAATPSFQTLTMDP